MKLWKLERIGDVGYDENVGFVVASHTEDGARIYAVARKHGDEPSSVWENSALSTCQLIGTAAEGLAPGIVFESFDAG